MAEIPVQMVVNGRILEKSIVQHRLLRDFIHDDLELTGTKTGCEDGMCGACSVHLDGRVVKSCLVLAVEADGATVTTVEGLADGQELHPVQQAFLDNFGMQCGFCTPGFLMTIAALVHDHPNAQAEEVRELLAGNICRCTGYTTIVAAYLDAARSVRANGTEENG